MRFSGDWLANPLSRGSLVRHPPITMALECGCVARCSGLCSLAKAAGRPRLDHSNAADPRFEPPNLNKMKGEINREEREAACRDDGKCVLWYWQMTGKAWDGDA